MVVTECYSRLDEYSYAFLYDYDGNTIIDLGTLPVNDTEFGLTSSAYDINEMNQVVGQSWLVSVNTSLNDPAKYHAFIWEPAADGSLENGVMTDLNNLIQLPTGWILTRATAINENGDIAGVGLVDGIEHGFLLTNGTISAQPPAQNQPPVANASADMYSGKAPLGVTFDSSASTDTDGAITGSSWDFMDGSPIVEGAELQHIFTMPGTYRVTLTVTDDQGMTASSTIIITVRKGKRK